MVIASASVLAADRTFTSYSEARPVLDAQRGHLPPELENPTPAKWNAWTKAQDQAIRARLEQGDLDSMINLLLFGTSFTKQPGIRIANITEASKSGILRARVDDLVAGLRNSWGNERLVFIAGLLRRQPASSQPGVFVYENLERVLKERTDLAQRPPGIRIKPCSINSWAHEGCQSPDPGTGAAAEPGHP